MYDSTGGVNTLNVCLFNHFKQISHILAGKLHIDMVTVEDATLCYIVWIY